MECLVTGASGFVGRGLLETLAAAGWTGTATGRTPPRGLPPGWRGLGRDEILRGLVDPGRPEAIVHLEVRQGEPRDLGADLEVMESVNVGGTWAWLDWAAHAGVGRFVLVSSVMAVEPSRGRRTEDSPAASGPTYGGSKARAESAVRTWARASADRRAVILRAAPVYGPDRASNFRALVRRVLAGRPAIIGSGESLRSLVSRRNLAAAIAFSLDLPVDGCSVFNVSDPRSLAQAELAALIARLGDAPPPRRLPLWTARMLAPFGDLLAALTGGDPPISSAVLRAAGESSEAPCDRLLAAGFVHPESTEEGFAELVASTEGRGR